MIWLLFLFLVSTQAEWNLEDWFNQKVNDPATNEDILITTADKELEYTKEEDNMITLSMGNSNSKNSMDHYLSFEYPTDETFNIAYEISETCVALKLGFPIRHPEKTTIYFLDPSQDEGDRVDDGTTILKKDIKVNELWCSVPQVKKTLIYVCERIAYRCPDDSKQVEIHEIDETINQFISRSAQKMEIAFADALNITEYKFGDETRTRTRVVERGDPGSVCTMWNAVANEGIRYGAFDLQSGGSSWTCADYGWEDPTHEDCMDQQYSGSLDSTTSHMMAWWYFHETQPANYRCNYNTYELTVEYGHEDHYTHKTTDDFALLCKLDVRDKAVSMNMLEHQNYFYELNNIFRTQIALRYWAEKNCIAPLCMLGAHDIQKFDYGMAIPLIVIPVDVGWSYYELSKSGYSFVYAKGLAMSYCYRIIDEKATLGGAKVSASPAGFPPIKSTTTSVGKGLYRHALAKLRFFRNFKKAGAAAAASSDVHLALKKNIVKSMQVKASTKGVAGETMVKNSKMRRSSNIVLSSSELRKANAKRRWASMRNELDTKIADTRKFKRFRLSDGSPILRKSQVSTFSRIKSFVRQHQSKITRTLNKISIQAKKLRNQYLKINPKLRKKAEGKAQGELSGEVPEPPNEVSIEFWYETGTCYDYPCSLLKRFTGFSTDSEELHKAHGVPGKYDWFQMSIEFSFITASYKAIVFKAANGNWDRTLLNAHAQVSQPNALEMTFALMGGVSGLAMEFMITLELGTGKGRLQLDPRDLYAYGEILGEHALNPSMTKSKCISSGCGNHTVVSNQIKLKSSAEPFMNIPLTHYRDTTGINKYDGHVPSALPGELFLLGLAQNNSNSKIISVCPPGEICKVGERAVPFDKYSALQHGVSHVKINVNNLQQLTESYVYPIEARGITDNLVNHPYVHTYNDSLPMIAIVSDETCETFGLTPILDIENNPAVKAEVEKLFATNTVRDPKHQYTKTSDPRDIFYYVENGNKAIWKKTEIVTTFKRDDAQYDIDDMDAAKTPVDSDIYANRYSYIPPGLTIVSKSPYIMDRDLYIVKKEFNPLGFRSKDMYGNPPSHIAKCTNQFRCICFKGDEYKYVRKDAVVTEQDSDYDYMVQPVHSLHECKIAAAASGWNSKVDYNTQTPGHVEILRFSGVATFGCRVGASDYKFVDVPYTMETEELSWGKQVKYNSATSTRSNSIVKLIRRAKATLTTAQGVTVLTNEEGARRNDFIVHKTHIKQGGYSYFPIYRNYDKIKYLNTPVTYLHDNLSPYRLIQEDEDYFFNNNFVESYRYIGEKQEGTYGEKPYVVLTMHSVNTTDDPVPQIIKDTPTHIYNTDWSGIAVDMDIFENGVLVGGAHTKLKHIACRPLAYLDGEQSYYRLNSGTLIHLEAYEDLDGNTDARLCGHLPDTNVDDSISCELSHSFPNQCPKGYGMGVSKWGGTSYNHTTDTGDVPFVNGIYRQCSKCPQGTTSPDGHTRCLGHEHKLGESTLFDDPYSAYVHATHLQKYHFEEGNDYHPNYHTVGVIDYIDNEVYSDTRYLICTEGFVPKRMQMPSGVTKENAVTAYADTCSGYTCERCPKQFIELQQMCVPCPPGSVAGWALGSTTNPNGCVGADVPKGYFFDSQNPGGSTVGDIHYPYATHCDHWLYHPEGGIGAYQNQENQIKCETAVSGSMAGFNGRVMVRESVPGQRVNNDRTNVTNCKNHQVCDGEQIIGCAPGYIWYRQTIDREDEECELCNQEDIDHDEKDDYEYCDGTHRFQCADASYTEGTLQDEVYVGVRDTWTGSNLVSYESQEGLSPAGGAQYNYTENWDISQARVQDNLKWDGSDAVCKAVPNEYFAIDGEWKLHDCGYARDKCIHRTFHRIYPFRHPTNLAAKYMFTEAVRETSYDEIFRMSSRQCDDGFLKDGCLKEYCSREGQTNCWCGEEEDFCRAACVDGMCLPACGDQVCNPDYEICYGIGVDAECTRKCNGPMDNYCVTDHNGYARLCRHYNEDWNTTKFEYLNPESACFEEMPNIPETQCKSTTDRNCFCGREYHDDKHKACKDREIVSSCSVIQDDGTCTYMTLTEGKCLCGDDKISGTCYQMNGKCGPYGSHIPDCDFHLEKITNTLTQTTTECRPTGKEALINPEKCRKGDITKKYTGTIDNIEEKFECDGVASDEPGCMDRHAKNYNQYAVIPKKCEY